MTKKATPEKNKKKTAIKKSTDYCETAKAPSEKTGKLKKIGDLSQDELDNFYKSLCDDLVYWLTHSSSLSAGHCLLDRDAIVKSQGLHRPSIIDLKERYLDTGKIELRKPFEYTTDSRKIPKGFSPYIYNVTITSAIPVRIFRIGEFFGDDFNQYSYAHFFLLKFMLEMVDKRFYDFMRALNEGMKHQHATQDGDSNPVFRAATNIKSLLSLLKTTHRGYIGISLPDLFAVNPQSALMIHDLEYFNSQQTGKFKYEHLYTYMYSKETSQSFCAVLVELLERKLENIQSEITNPTVSTIDPLADLNLKQWLAAMPKTKTRERMKIAFQMLGIKDEDDNLGMKVSWSAGELIFVFRALQRSGIFIPKLHLSKIATAMTILTGKSVDTYYNKYIDMNETEFSIQSTCSVKPNAIDGAKNSIRKLAIKVKDEMDALIEEIKKTGK